MWGWLSEKLHGGTFSAVANAASIISLLIAVYVFFAVRKIKSFYVSKARIPELTDELKESGSRLLNLHRESESSKKDILLEVGRTEVTLKQLRKKVARPARKSVRATIKLVNNYSPYNQTQDYLWQIYVELQKLIQEIIAVQSDRSWENPNG